MVVVCITVSVLEMGDCVSLRVLDLFAGAGGFTLAGEMAGGFVTKAFCEIDKHAQKVLAKNWPGVPIFDDVTKLKGSDVGAVDVITGGFPCQDVSASGPKLGTVDGERSSLFREILRIAAEIDSGCGRKPWLIMENVEHLISGGGGHWFGAVMSGLAEVGYDAEWHVLPASYVGACHRRSRVWIIAYPNSLRLQAKGRPVFTSHHATTADWQTSGAISEICGGGRRARAVSRSLWGFPKTGRK